MNKKQLRKQMLAKREALSVAEQQRYSEQIARQLCSADIYGKYDNICIYQAFRGEVVCDTIRENAWRDGKTVYVPVSDAATKTMNFCKITKETVWKTGAYGILEPVITEECEWLQQPALVLMPGLVFDLQKHRIGYGGGYYDKYLAQHTIHTTIALCYRFQILTDALPFEEFDVLPDYIVTETGWI